MIDTHQHLIHPERFNYSWAEDIPPLQGSFRLEEYLAASAGCGIEGTIFMEVDVDAHQSADEARFFCGLAEDATSGILGVIAAARPENEGFEVHLDAIAHAKLAGIRRVLHTQPDELSRSDLFRHNLRLLGRRGLTFDLCVLQRQLDDALDLVRACPGTRFVLDHCGVPDIAANGAPRGAGFLQWAGAVRMLAAEPNVWCKISGLSVYSSEAQRNGEGLHPYLATVMEAFTPSRCLWGGDWPVVNLGCGLPTWCGLTRQFLARFSGAERDAVLSLNAQALYLKKP